MYQNTFEITDELLASKGQRILHHFIDLVPQYAIMYGLTYGLFYLGEFTGNYTLNDIWNGMSEIEDFIISYVFMFVYYFFMEKYTFKTLGKFATNTIVVSVDGNEPTTKQILKRSFSRWIPFDALSFLGTNGKGWHDSIADCYVVKADKFNEKKNSILELEQIGLIGEDI
nr:RDD family protein [uncultured Psychroserpens sp.]|tara:strand:+ start:1085 stop:1594 length:510 start_codon:yes stop_codon:yes gene_type:complete